MVEPILELGNDHVLIEYDCALGTFDVKDVAAGAFVMGGVHSGLTEAASDGGGIAWATGSDTYISSELDDAARSLRIKHLVKPGITLTQHFTLGEASEDGYLLLHLTVENESAEPLLIEELRSMQLGEQGYLQIGSDPMRCLVYTDPYYKIPAAVREVFDGFDSRMFHKAHSQGIQYLERDYETPWHSTFDGVIKDPLTGYGAVFGYTTCRRFLPQIAFTYNKESDRDVFRDFTLLTHCEGRGCGPGETLVAETCYLYLGYDIERAQEQYADLIAGSMGAVKLDRPVSGWCSWHYAFFQVTEDDVERNLRFAAEHPEVFTPEPGGFEYILIDYGWQQTIGSPAVNKEQFPRGMKRMADMIREAGFRPGIWIAPFWIEADAEIVTTHPEYLLHNADGSLALGPRTFKHPYAYRLDLSHPGAQQYVLDQLAQLIHEWGYALIKMDFLEVATVSLTENRSQFRFHSDDRTSIEILRDMCMKMQELADAANNDIWLSPCGSPVMALCGIFKTNFVAEDAIIRFIPDKIHMHGGVKAFAQTLALRRYYQDRIWTNNYESVILRSPRPYKEARINVTSAGLAGGVMFNGDELPALTQDRLDLLAKMLPLYPKQARPLDLYESNFSSKWLLRVDTSFDTWWVAALFNWEEEARSFSIRLDSDGLQPDRRYRIYDFWNQQPLGIARGGIAIPGVAPHDCKVIAIRENRPHPWLLSTDYHLTQGGVELGQLSWDEEHLTLSGVFIGRRAGNAVLTFTVPETYAIRAIDCPGAAHQVTEEGVRLELTGLGGEDRSFKLMFA